MEARRDSNGLYLFPLTLKSKYYEKKIVGLVDTGSNICACSYVVPVTFRARATSFKSIANPSSAPTRSLGYSMTIAFDDKSMMTHVYRLPLKMDGIDFILGLSILNHCNITIKENIMSICWNPSSTL